MVVGEIACQEYPALQRWEGVPLKEAQAARRVALLALLVSAYAGACVPGCGPPALPDESLPPFDHTGIGYCTSDEDCVSLRRQDEACLRGFCTRTVQSSGDEYAFCTKPCETDTDCESEYGNYSDDLVCGLLEDGSRGCLLSSCADRRLGFTCIDGLPAVCTLADESHCRDCGCPSNLRCEAEVGCLPLLALGEPCSVDGDCTTSHCSEVSHVCRVPVGQPCTAENCDRCLVAGDWSYCSRYCGLLGGDCNNDLCLTYHGVATCSPRCSGVTDPSCPGACRSVQSLLGYTEYYCDCEGYCETVEPPREIGQLCESDEQCATGECVTLPRECDPVCGYAGWCTQSCATAADCGPGVECVRSVCAEGECSFCAPTCADGWDCPEGICNTMASVDGDLVSACDPRRSDGYLCVEDAHCFSGSCIDQRCAPAGGLANGATCTSPTECASGSCVASTCRGGFP